jgi:hypothetical protein
VNTTFFKTVVALRSGASGEQFADVVAELKRRRDNANKWLVSTETPEGFARYQGAYRALDELILDIERADEIARLPSDNRKKRPDGA